ncbi:UNVERIFIED_CONTAM: hypothetical protein GTU68_014925 [Idotea baltica]|nr:hypothetical protein [Idotea baltica]
MDTRHNIGFDVLEHMAEESGVEWSGKSKGDIATVKHKGRTLILLKPNTYMNLSGEAVNYWMQKEKIKKENLLIVVDDLNLPFGKMRLRAKGSDGGHNGLKSVAQHFGGQNYARIRIGIGDDFKQGQQVDFVLGKWDSDEREKLPKLVKKAAGGVKSFAAIGMKFTMENFNK